MSRLYVYQEIEKLVRRHGTRDPFELMEAMRVQVRVYYDLTSAKGFTRYFLRRFFVGLNGNLPESEQRIVAAHELGHIVLHAAELRTAPLFDTAVYDKRSSTEYEANLFAADLLLPDEDVAEAAAEPEADFSSLCRALDTVPGLMNFKILSMRRRGIPVMGLPIPAAGECESRFLAGL